MWLLYDLRRINLPLPEILNLFAAVLFVFSFDILFASPGGLRIDHKDHFQASKRRIALRFPRFANRVHDLHQFRAANLRVRKLSLPKTANKPHFVSLTEKLNALSNRDLEVVFGRHRAYLYTLDILLLGLLVLLKLRLLVLVTTVVSNPNNRRSRRARNQNQIQTLVLRTPQGVARSQHTDLLTLVVDNPNLGKTEQALVNVRWRFASWRSSWPFIYRNPPRKT